MGASGKGVRIALLLAAIFALAAILTVVGCSREKTDPGMQGEKAKATPAKRPRANDDHATTVEEREVQIKMVANDTGQSLQIDKLNPGQAHGSIVCEASIDTGRIQSCAYTPVKGFTGKDKFSYVVRDANGKTDSAMVYVRVKSD